MLQPPPKIRATGIFFFIPPNPSLQSQKHNQSGSKKLPPIKVSGDIGGSHVGLAILRTTRSHLVLFTHPPLLHLIDSLLRLAFITRGLPCLPTMSSTHLLELCPLDAGSFAPHRYCPPSVSLDQASLSLSLLPQPPAGIITESLF